MPAPPQPQPQAQRRSAGRPSRLSRAQVIAAALNLLADDGLEGFSVAKLGKRLGASPMSLYTYFPGRDALLEAVADEAFKSFSPPSPQADWRDYVREWLREVAAHFEQYPIALRVIVWEDHLSAGWLRAWLPLVRTLAAVQPDAERLAAALSWFSHAAIGLINGRIMAPRDIADLDEDVAGAFSEEDRRQLRILQRHDRARDDRWVLAFGFDNLVSGLERLLVENAPLGPIDIQDSQRG